MKLSQKIWKELGALVVHVESLDHDAGTAKCKATAAALDVAAVEAVLAAHDPLLPDPDEVAAEAERTARTALRTEAKASAMFAALQTATLAQIDTWVESNFPSATAAQKRLFKLMAAVAGLYLRER